MAAKIKTIMKNKISLIFLFLFFFTLPEVAYTQDIPDEFPSDTEMAMSLGVSVQLRALDKITARITEVNLPVGNEQKFGTLIIKARYCRSRPPQEIPESFAYLEIDDVSVNGKRERIFDGWMLASSPAVSALEHSVYDVWVIGCKTVSPSDVEPNT